MAESERGSARAGGVDESTSGAGVRGAAARAPLGRAGLGVGGASAAARAPAGRAGLGYGRVRAGGRDRRAGGAPRAPLGRARSGQRPRPRGLAGSGRSRARAGGTGRLGLERGRVLQALHWCLNGDLLPMSKISIFLQQQNFPCRLQVSVKLQSRPAFTLPIRVYPDDCICWSHIQAWSHARCIFFV